MLTTACFLRFFSNLESDQLTFSRGEVDGVSDRTRYFLEGELLSY